MARKGKNGSDSEVSKLRKQGGEWLKGLRQEADLTQRALADRLGFEYYTYVSQIETGSGRPPPDKLVDYARALKLKPSNFTKGVLKYYDPYTYHALFEAD